MGIACGLINAIFITKLRISSIIVSIATLNIFYGLLIFFTGGRYITSLPKFFRDGVWWFEYDDFRQRRALRAEPAGFRCWSLVFVCTSAPAQPEPMSGRQIYAMGGNKDAAQRLGFHVFRLNCLVYGYLGLIAGIASLVQAQLALNGDADRARRQGTRRSRGGRARRERAWRAALGTFIFGTILGVALLAHPAERPRSWSAFSSYWSQLFVGLIILVAVSITAWSERRRRKAKAIN